MEIVTGYTGTPHITSEMDRVKNKGLVGRESYILGVGSGLQLTRPEPTGVGVGDGAVCHQGCIGIIEAGTYDLVTFDNGSQGVNRKDLIVCRYERDSETNVESMSIVLIKGTPTSGTPTAPAYNDGSIQDGDSPVDMPIGYITLTGTSSIEVTKIATEVHNISYMTQILGNSPISTTVTEAINQIEQGTFDQNAIRFKTGSITIADGTTSSPTTTSLNISDIRPPGFEVWAAFLIVGGYVLPYISNSGGNTRISALGNTGITILNSTSGWGTSTYYLTVIYKKS